MRLRSLALPLSLVVASLASCSAPEPADRDAARDDAGRDAAQPDTGSPIDTGPPSDTGGDAAAPDAPTTDAGLLDCPDLQTWGWADETFVSEAAGVGSNLFAGGEWAYDAAYAAGQLRADAEHAREPGTRSIRAFLDPSIPVPPDADFEANFRAEIARRPWHDAVPLGSELWIGFSYYLPPTYVQDTATRATIFQLHAGRHSPPIEIAHWVPIDYDGAYGSQLHILRRWRAYDAGLDDRATVPIELEPDHWYDFVLHVIWDVEDGTAGGLTELWVNGTRYYSAEGPNTYSAGTDPEPPGDTPLPYGGTPKLGWYKWPWHQRTDVDASAAVGVTELEMFIGAVRILQHPAGAHVGDVGYDCVAPRGPRP